MHCQCIEFLTAMNSNGFSFLIKTYFISQSLLIIYFLSWNVFIDGIFIISGKNFLVVCKKIAWLSDEIIFSLLLILLNLFKCWVKIIIMNNFWNYLWKFMLKLFIFFIDISIVRQKFFIYAGLIEDQSILLVNNFLIVFFQ
jgi:hypothetical protein